MGEVLTLTWDSGALSLSLAHSRTDVLEEDPHQQHLGNPVAFERRLDWWHRQQRELSQHRVTTYWLSWQLQKWSC